MIAKSQEFHYEQFCQLSGSELVDYMEPLVNVNDVTSKVSDDVLEQMLGDLEAFDEYHLVYALELGALHSASKFAPRIPQFLAHSQQSVRLAAHRVLQKLPQTAVTTQLVNDVKLYLARCPEREVLKDSVSQLESALTPNLKTEN